jgi:aminopeptidase N
MRRIAMRVWGMILINLAAVSAQPGPPAFTRADTLRGMLSPERSCYNITYYHLEVRVDPVEQTIRGSNDIHFTVVEPFNRLQIDLFENLAIEKIVCDGRSELGFTREYNAVFVDFPTPLAKGSAHHIKVHYGGKPTEGKNPPWQGGVTWTKDPGGNPWVVVTCQGLGASVWWPNKDHQADEPDSMLISVAVPKGLMDISNGRLRGTQKLPGGWTRYDWFISYPINNYCVTLNIGKYAHFSDLYGEAPPLTLDYYVLPENLERAKQHFAQVKPMMAAYEHYFGPYPFRRDGYKLVECPYTGMEHQSAIAWGNRFLGGYRGRAPSVAGLKFDFIIIHESAHEWWGNSITAKDVADMWIHESFGAYAEALFVEHQWGFGEALAYINGKKPNVRNAEPIIGIYNVQREGSGDMYDKGQLALNTLRSAIGNDSLWFALIRGLYQTLQYQTVSAEDVVGYINRQTGTDYSWFFDQYFRKTRIPELEVRLSFRGDSAFAAYRWRADVQNFCMPVEVTTAQGRFERITPTTAWQKTAIAMMPPQEFMIDEDRFYANLRLSWSYIDPAAPPTGSGRSTWF